jgi:hypothetical protein
MIIIVARQYAMPQCEDHFPSMNPTRSPSRMRAFFLLVPVLASACAEAPPPPQFAAVQSVPTPAQQDCREFDTPVAIGGEQQRAHGTACLQSDGSWKIEQHVGDQAPQTYMVLPPEYQAYYPPAYFEDPWFYGPPLFVGGAFIGGGRGFHHHHFGFHNRFHGGFHDRFHAGSHDRFHGGFRGGFHGGFHGRR